MQSVPSGSSRAPLRAPSPGVSAFYSLPAKSGQNATAHARQFALSAAASFQECAQLIPTPYREVLVPDLERLRKIAEKRVHCGQVLRRLEQHLAEKTQPSALKGFGPASIQVSSEFFGTDEEKASRDALAAFAAKYESDVLAQLIAVKKAELKFLQEQTTPEIWFDELQTAAKNFYDANLAHRRVPKSKTVVVEGGKQEQRVEWVQDPSVHQVYTQVVEDILQIGYKVIDLVISSGVAKEKKTEKKKTIKEAADMELAFDKDDSLNAGQIAALVAAEVRKASGQVSDSLFHSLLPIYKPHVGDYWTSGRAKQEAQGAAVARSYQPGQATGPARKQDLKRKGRSWEAQGDGWEREGSGSLSAKIQEAVSSDFVYKYPATYPDVLLEIPIKDAVDILITRVSAADLAVAHSRSGVHLGPGVKNVLDSHVNKSEDMYARLCSTGLGSGFKYMFPRKMNMELPQLAYEQWCNKVRWNWHHRHDDQTEDFDPDYFIRSDALADVAPQYIENGLNMGRRTLQRMIQELMSKVIFVRNMPVAVEVKELADLVERLDLLVLPSDKNLGCAVVRKAWFIEQAESHLSQPNSYRKVSQIEAFGHLQEQALACRRLAAHPYIYDPKEKRGQKSRFLISKAKIGEDLDKIPQEILKGVPRFYIIPKIHKNPWKGRPIVPGHGAIHAPAAKMASKLLKPLVEAQPYIIHGTKHFIQQIERIRCNRPDRMWIVGGDIEAYYPSVPTAEAVELVTEMYEASIRNDPNDLRDGFFSEVMEVANSTIVMRFQEDWYVQTDGLAMGMAHSPDLANLYGAYYENQIIPRHPQIKYYGRYIDDVIFFIEAETAEEARSIAENLVIGRCRIVWEPAARYGVFLDVRLWVEKDRIHHKPHVKTGNHLERIPWTSAHPLDVKRGTFMGELSRMATLCSTLAGYERAVLQLRGLYIERGYPPNLVNYWYEKFASHFWENRLGERRPNKEVSVLRTEFNPIWDHFNIKAVEEAVKDQWRKEMAYGDLAKGTESLPQSLWIPWTIARKRTPNLGDAMNRLRKKVLNYTVEEEDLQPSNLDPWFSDDDL
jgi:hypothetical protein